jgi:hypothetical protein
MNAKVFEDGIIQVGSVIQMPDIYDSNQQQGYITGRAGNNFDTSEPIAFTGSMYVLVTDSWVTRPALSGHRPQRHEVRLHRGNTRHSAQHLERRHRAAPVALSHCDSGGTDSQLWTVNSIKPNTDNTVSLTVAEYSDAIYQ